MSIGVPTDPAVKEAVLLAIKNEGLKAAEAARKFNIPVGTIYTWLQRGVLVGGAEIENAKLRRQVKELLALVGEITADMSKLKKNTNAKKNYQITLINQP